MYILYYIFPIRITHISYNIPHITHIVKHYYKTVFRAKQTTITVSDRVSDPQDIAKAIYRFNKIFIFGQMRTRIGLRIDLRNSQQ